MDIMVTHVYDKYRFAYYGYKTISINDDKTVNIISSGKACLRFNTSTGQE